MKKFGLVILGIFLALFFFVLGLGTAMTPAPSETDKAVVAISFLFFVVGIGLVIVGLVKLFMDRRRKRE